MKQYQIYKTALILSCFFMSCSSDDTIGIIEISQEIKDLIYFTGDQKASTVLINAQSGPGLEFDTKEIDQGFAGFNTSDILLVNVHQVQTLTPSLFTGDDITLDQAINFNAESIEMLYKVVKYFKDQGRTVYVLGISFGAFVVQELIAKQGIDAADKYLIMVGRLDINDVIWQGISEGRGGYFEDGINPIVDDEVATDISITDRNLDKLTAGLGMNRYTELLNKFQDLSKITYIYGETDQFVGRLTNAEVEFLQSKNVNVIAGSGGHDDTIKRFSAQGLSEAFGIE